MILMIDDEPMGISSYKEELELSGYNIVYHRKVDDALQVFTKSSGQVELIILDIMMPPGLRFRDDPATEKGLRTGVRCYEYIRRKAPKLPILILTNVSDPKVGERFQGDEHCRFLQKTDYLPFQLADAVREFVAPCRPEQGGNP